MLAYVHEFLRNLLFSGAVESVIAVGLYRVLRRSWAFTPAIAASVGTALTIPYVWYVFPTLFWATPSATIMGGELFAVLIETFFYRSLCNVPYRTAFLLSLCANGASYGLGILFRI